MKKLMIALAVFLACGAFAQEANKGTTSAAAPQSMTSVLDATHFSLIYLQDSNSAKAGLGLEKDLPNGFKFHWATVYDTNGSNLATGPLIGYPVLKSKYINIEPLVGVMQDISGAAGRTRFVYGGTVSVDILSVLDKNSPAPVVARTLSIGKDGRRGVGGLTPLMTYSRRDGFGGGVGYTYELSPSFGVTAGVVAVKPANWNAAFDLGLTARVWGDKNTSLSLWGGGQYCLEGRISPAVGVAFTTTALQF